MTNVPQTDRKIAVIAALAEGSSVNFGAAVGMHFAYYNFVRRHNTLRCTPAMTVDGVTPSFWSIGNLLEATR